MSAESIKKKYKGLIKEFSDLDHQGRDEIRKIVNEFQAYHSKINSAFKQKSDKRAFADNLDKVINIMEHMVGDLRVLKNIIKIQKKDISEVKSLAK